MEGFRETSETISYRALSRALGLGDTKLDCPFPMYYLSICLSIYLFIYLTIYLSTYKALVPLIINIILLGHILGNFSCKVEVGWA